VRQDPVDRVVDRALGRGGKQDVSVRDP
jgi:hypothetical protein